MDDINLDLASPFSTLVGWLARNQFQEDTAAQARAQTAPAAKSKRSSKRPSTRPDSSSAASTSGGAASTREPSREQPPPSSAARSSLISALVEAPSERHDRGKRTSFLSRQRGVVLDSIEDELAELRPKLKQQITKVAQLKVALQEARIVEHREARDQRINAAERQERRIKITSRMQAVVRGWLVRKRVVKALNHRSKNNFEMAAKLPSLLKEQLMQLQHNVHDLEYRFEDHVASAVKLQAWWRGIVARRVVRLITFADRLEVVCGHMHMAATVMQAWYRGGSTKRAFRQQIRDKMELTRQQQFREMEIAMYCIIHIQQSFREKLARRQMHKLLDEAKRQAKARATPSPSEPSTAEEEPKVVVDTWMPATTHGVEPAGPGRAGVIISSPPKHDWELQKIQDAGIIPFYGASSREVVRHKIGGSTAQLMQRQMGIGSLSGPCDNPDARAIEGLFAGDVPSYAAITDATCLQEALGEPWDVYPEGLTPGFVSGLDSDVWAKGGRAKSYQNSLAIRGVSRSRRKPQIDTGPRPCTKVAIQPPSNAELRLQSREERRRRDHAMNDDANSSDVAKEDTHPMFINAPALPPPTKRSGRSARFLQAALGNVEDEGSWNQTPVARPPCYRNERRPRDAPDEKELWTMLNVPFDMSARTKKAKPGEVDHERVWGIAAALSEKLADKLPALTNG